VDKLGRGAKKNRKEDAQGHGGKKEREGKSPYPWSKKLWTVSKRKMYNEDRQVLVT
jgi:hypothetical protein